MIRDSVTIDETIAFLNELLEIDRSAISELFEKRVPCNKQMADHPTVQVQAQPHRHYVGLLGILNGLFGIIENGNRSGWGEINSLWDQGRLIKFVRTSTMHAEPEDGEE